MQKQSPYLSWGYVSHEGQVLRLLCIIMCQHHRHCAMQGIAWVVQHLMEGQGAFPYLGRVTRVEEDVHRNCKEALLF